ncbi:DUF968 domain-containing protein [Pantoea agglomerans]|uniref:DUF968 domain-containing protein n=1 Tax=Enterobacter agglomerans TaxID=549 RepID=UPI0013BD630A|nr:DUF968 domain-containing protein [Pantoea agglomerans]NEG58211.1 DUF968 domain-containing protein [Pantoea agglomerans]NEG99924.1 DUF968 domain-containing protein [Pantoea agglomerans]NEH04113.1 DUF968 domain-containing protein [Pantoea agglomerans]NEH14484.1 DUF968 domain-containing protein [Pantoea agglomerans]
MRALLTPEVVPRLGVVLLKPGKELMRLFSAGRVLVESEPENMARLSTGRVPDARQPLAEDEALIPFFTDDRVIRAAGGLAGLECWLERNACACQYPHSDYHHHELVTMRHAPGAMMLCWYCDNRLREHTTDLLADIARRNVIDWIIDTVLIGLRFNRERELSIAELCWWAIYVGVADAIPEELAARALQMPYEPFSSVYKESEIIASNDRPTVALQRRIKTAGSLKRCKSQVMQEQQPKVIALSADPESPESFMLRPKRRRWENEKYTRWVKSQPCECCRRPADDPHHVIGHGMGGTATKAHDLFVFPLCRECHDKLHADVAAFEQKYGTQLELLFRFLNHAIAIGVIGTDKK